MTLDIPNFRLLEKLGTGAQSRIYRARCMRTGRDYAVKIVKIQSPEDVRIANLLRAEYTIGSLIDHPAIRKVYELRMIRQRFRLRGAMLFMEYVDGVPLTDGKAPRGIPDMLRVFVRAAEGLHAMHCAGYVHADLKPGNILLMPNDQVKLIDFGQSSRLGEAKTKIQGTPDYIAPEQVRMERLDQRTDVFGLGAALHRVLTGRPVPTQMNQTINLDAPTRAGLLRTRAGESAGAELPMSVARLIEDCCAGDMDGRLRDMPTFIERAEIARAILLRPEGELAASGETVLGLDEELEADLAETGLLPLEDFLADLPDELAQ
ncbi:MAG TPA: serine/threonine-protein kinase [Phycisphaerae bacterium]|nr:serine/threonine-protein kinase [Phycisphaerae bacterium]HNU44212.1 serine/threonine-protein kinase [Phycisphaerae bacterium]